jgi:hypothetical protein
MDAVALRKSGLTSFTFHCGFQQANNIDHGLVLTSIYHSSERPRHFRQPPRPAPLGFFLASMPFQSATEYNGAADAANIAKLAGLLGR